MVFKPLNAILHSLQVLLVKCMWNFTGRFCNIEFWVIVNLYLASYQEIMGCPRGFRPDCVSLFVTTFNFSYATAWLKEKQILWSWSLLLLSMKEWVFFSLENIWKNSIPFAFVREEQDWGTAYTSLQASKTLHSGL